VSAPCHPSGLPAVQGDRKDAPDPGRMDTSALQRRTVAVLMLTQVVGGIGVAIGIVVGALLAARMGGTQVSGLGQSSLVVGAALLAIPVTRLMARRGRRPGLVLAYLVGAAGAALVVLAAAWGSVPLLFVGLFAFGGGSAANYQARYTAVDLASPERRGRQLSWVVWAATIGSVAGPNLAQVADDSVRRFGVVKYSGPFAFSTVAFLVSGLIVFVLLRPDPLVTARRLAGDPKPTAPAGGGIRAAAREVLASPSARLGVAAVAVGHLVMVGVMAMTPLHIDQAGGDHGDTLRIVGIVLSIHIAGMYALSPIVGWLTDRAGRRTVILAGTALLLAACAVAGTAGDGVVRLTVGLVLLGQGWSCTMVAGSTLFAESVPLEVKAPAQGLSDLTTGVGGATAGLLSGVIVQFWSYPALTVLAALAVVPLLALALRTRQSGAGTPAGDAGSMLRPVGTREVADEAQ
jgi:MFS family permease